MTSTLLTDTTDPTQTEPATAPTQCDGWDLDVSFLEQGAGDLDTLIYMTNDGCGQTCQTACTGTCR
jgi:FxLD family lantipeptide